MSNFRNVALFDIDGVIYDGHTIFDQIQDQEKRGIITKGTWNKILLEVKAYKLGNKTYKDSANEMLKIHALALKGRLCKDILIDTCNFLSKNSDKFFPYFGELISKLKKTHDIYFVTTNFQFMPVAVGKLFGIGNYFSSVAEVRDGKFTGKVKLSLAGNKGVISKIMDKYGVKGSIAVGDSENDVDMLDKVEFPFVMEPNENLEEFANKKGWQIANRNTISKKIISTRA